MTIYTAFAMTTCLKTCQRLVLRIELAASFLSLRRNEKIFLRSLNVSLPRATLVAWWKQSAFKQHLFLDYFATLVMPKKTRWPRGLKPLAMTYYFRALLKISSLEGTRLGVAKAARSPPSLPFLGRRFFNLILYEL